MKPNRKEKPFNSYFFAVWDKERKYPPDVYKHEATAYERKKYGEEILDTECDVIPVTITERGKAEVCRWEGEDKSGCGREYYDWYRFCPFCGKKIKVMKGRG